MDETERIRREWQEALKREAHLRSLCIEVRMSQVDYFATKSKDALQRAKAAENRLDIELFGTPLKFKMVMLGSGGELTADEHYSCDHHEEPKKRQGDFFSRLLGNIRKSRE